MKEAIYYKIKNKDKLLEMAKVLQTSATALLEYLISEKYDLMASKGLLEGIHE